MRTVILTRDCGIDYDHDETASDGESEERDE